jgi:hypothetical protein
MVLTTTNQFCFNISTSRWMDYDNEFEEKSDSDEIKIYKILRR